MGEVTKVEWTNNYYPDGVLWKKQMTFEIPGATFSPWWGCNKVSAACRDCYAEAFARRFHENLWGPAKTSKRKMQRDSYWAAPLKWNKECADAGIKRKVFCASMADVFEANPVLEESRMRLWDLIEATPNLIWLVLTKRIENVLMMIPDRWNSLKGGTCPENVWFGATMEDQQEYDKRMPHLQRVKEVTGATTFISMEPLLSAVDMRFDTTFSTYRPDWVITGSESGNKKRIRVTSTDWVRSLRDQCTSHDVLFFYKQSAVNGKKNSTPELDGKRWTEMPAAL